MDRSQVLAKIKAILALQERTSFEGEAEAAAKMIYTLCEKYGVSVSDASPCVTEEVFQEGLRIDKAESILLQAVASFYDAVAFTLSVRNGKKSLIVLGSESQQIQVRLYFDYLLEVMTRECDIAYRGERTISIVTGMPLSKGFKSNFCKAFASKVYHRLEERKRAEGRAHADASATSAVASKLRICIRKTVVRGDGAMAGAHSGSEVSLNKQTTGSRTLRLPACT